MAYKQKQIEILKIVIAENKAESTPGRFYDESLLIYAFFTPYLFNIEVCILRLKESFLIKI